MRRSTVHRWSAVAIALSLVAAACGDDDDDDAASPPATEATAEASSEPEAPAEESAEPESSTEPEATAESNDAPATTPAEAPSEPIHLGMSAPFSGPAAFFGEMMTSAIEFALAESPHTAIAGAVEVATEDDACSPEKAVSIATKFATEGRVSASIGPGCSGAMTAAQPKLAEAELPHMSIGYLPAITEAGDEFVFRTVPTDIRLMAALADELATQHDSVAIVHGTAGYSVGVAAAFQAAVEALGVEVVSVDTYEEGATDFAGQVSRLEGTSATALFFGGYEAELGLLTRQTRQYGIELPIYGPTAMGNKEFIANTGDAAEGVIFASNFILADPNTAEWTARYTAEYGTDPTDVVASTYLAGLVLVDAWQRAGADARGVELRDAIRATDLMTDIGPVSFTETGDLVAPRVLIGSVTGGTAVVLHDVSG